MKKLFIPIIVGTTRPNRYSIHAAKLIHQIASSLPEIESQLVDPKDFNLPGDGDAPENRDEKYTAITDQADGFVIVIPEYNHGYPGSLKRLLDSELKNYIHKPVTLVGVSSGPWGGVRAIENLSPVVRELGLMASFADLHFPKVKKLFSEQGEIDDENREKYEKRIKKAYQELIWLTKTLQWGRTNLKDTGAD